MKKNFLVNGNRFQSIKLLLKVSMMIVVAISMISLTSCGKDEDDVPDSEITGPGSGSGGGGGDSQSSYSLSQLNGYWVEENAWNRQKSDISYIKNNSMFSDAVLDAVTDVSGFYVDADNEKAYELNIEATTTRYSNNEVAGNKIIASWSCLDGVTVYVMNVTGSKYNSACSMSDKNTFSFRRDDYKVKSTSKMIGPDGTAYIKVNL